MWERKFTADTADDEVRRRKMSAHEESTRAAGGSTIRRGTTGDSAGEHSVAPVDNGGRGSKGGADVTGDVNSDVG